MQAYAPEIASLIGNILSDPTARDLEFSRTSVLNLPVQTAVKTGTSSDFRDSWAVGFNSGHTVGVWMGNLDQTPTDGVTGSTGPALLLRGVFAELTRGEETRPLFLSPRLVRRDRCDGSRDQTIGFLAPCAAFAEWFVPGNQPVAVAARLGIRPVPVRLRRPTQGLQIAYDPRLPGDAQGFEFYVQGLGDADTVQWQVGEMRFESRGGALLWPLQRGEQRVHATVWRAGNILAEIGETRFTVK